MNAKALTTLEFDKILEILATHAQTEGAAEMARRLGISKSAVSMYECGNREPELELLQAMADLFGVGVGALLGREDPLVNGDPELTEYLEALRDRPELRMLFSTTRNATKEDIEKTVRIIEALRGGNADT